MSFMHDSFLHNIWFRYQYLHKKKRLHIYYGLSKSSLKIFTVYLNTCIKTIKVLEFKIKMLLNLSC